MNETEILAWLLEGDTAVRYQVHRDLQGEDRPDLQARIAEEGWGARFLAAQNPDGHWGRGFYQPKWISSHYTLLDLRRLELPPAHPAPPRTIEKILAENIAEDGGVNPAKTIHVSDVCVTGMFLDYACWFETPEDRLHSLIDFLLEMQMKDGGFNCNFNQIGAVHSSLHSSICVLEGLLTYRRRGYTYRLAEIEAVIPGVEEFILQHRLYRSDHTGEIINPRFLMLSFPGRYFYNILRALDDFRAADRPYDPRMDDALDVLARKQRKDGTWPLQAVHAGKVHFRMEQAGKPSRWNTLRALRVRRKFLAERERWRTFEDPAWPFRIRYPDPTPGGSSVRMEEHIQPAGHRVHFVSNDSAEVYFELGRYGRAPVAGVMAEFSAWLTSSEGGARITGRQDARILANPAVRIEAVWPAKRRWIHFFNLEGITYRVILDPESGINLGILATLERKL